MTDRAGERGSWRAGLLIGLVLALLGAASAALDHTLFAPGRPRRRPWTTESLLVASVAEPAVEPGLLDVEAVAAAPEADASAPLVTDDADGGGRPDDEALQGESSETETPDAAPPAVVTPQKRRRGPLRLLARFGSGLALGLPLGVVGGGALAGALLLTGTHTLALSERHAPPPVVLGPVLGKPIASSDLDVSLGPDDSYAVLGTLAAGSPLAVLGRTADADWLAVSYPPDSQGEGWVPLDDVSGLIDADPLPVLSYRVAANGDYPGQLRFSRSLTLAQAMADARIDLPPPDPTTIEAPLPAIATHTTSSLAIGLMALMAALGLALAPALLSTLTDS